MKAKTLGKRRYLWLQTAGCTIASASALYLTTGLGSTWQLAWVALVPLLWLAYGKAPLLQVVIATFISFALGNAGFLRPFQGMHAATLGVLMAILGLAIAAAIAVSLARLVHRRHVWWLTLLSFPAFWVSIEYLSSIVSPNGTIGSLAYTQAGVPMLIQSASLFGIWSITFLICFVANGGALALQNRSKAVPIVAVIALAFMINFLFGMSRLNDRPPQTVRVATIVKDLPTQRFQSTEQTWLSITTAYAQEIRQVVFANKGVSEVVLPEKLATLSPQWRTAVLQPLVEVAQNKHIRIVAGFENDTSGTAGQNIAIVFNPDGTSATYVKRQLLSSENNLTPGNKAVLLDDGKTIIEICKDMDFPRMIRADIHNQHTELALVLAEDFSVNKFDLLHARIASMRGVEDGFSVVRTARKGYITVNDNRGRILTEAHSTQSQFVARVTSIPVSQEGTFYSKIGDMFAWLCLSWSIVTLGYMTAKSLRGAASKKSV